MVNRLYVLVTHRVNIFYPLPNSGQRIHFFDSVGFCEGCVTGNAPSIAKYLKPEFESGAKQHGWVILGFIYEIIH